jgi:hypothetical protein
MKVYLKAETRTRQPPKIIQLRWWAFSYTNFRMLSDIQHVCPNQILETTEGEKVPIFKLDFDEWIEVEMINASVN